MLIEVMKEKERMEKGLLRENFKLKKKKVRTKVRNLETREKKERKKEYKRL